MSVSIPAISTGVFGGDKLICAKIICEALNEFSSQLNHELKVRLVVVNEEMMNEYLKHLTIISQQQRGIYSTSGQSTLTY
jgi:O-acetyl-ADP-ribose deacetylase (regulator of RNase III)